MRLVFSDVVQVFSYGYKNAENIVGHNSIAIPDNEHFIPSNARTTSAHADVMK